MYGTFKKSIKQNIKELIQDLQIENEKKQKNNTTRLMQLDIIRYNCLSLINFLEKNNIRDFEIYKIRLQKIEIDKIIQSANVKFISKIKKMIDEKLSENLGFKQTEKFFPNQILIRDIKNNPYNNSVHPSYNQAKIYKKDNEECVNVSYCINGIHVLEDENITTDNSQIMVGNQCSSYFLPLHLFLEDGQQATQITLIRETKQN